MFFREHMLHTMSCTTCTTIWCGNTSINDTSNCLSSSMKTTHTLEIPIQKRKTTTLDLIFSLTSNNKPLCCPISFLNSRTLSFQRLTPHKKEKPLTFLITIPSDFTKQ
jgi:hypothetical protein